MIANKTNFDNMLAIAKVAEQGHHNRRQLEFKIMISYMTLLALAIYHVIKPTEQNGTSLDVPWWLVLIACAGLLVILCFYSRWQYILHIASVNDVRRRDFYLKKAELLLHHMSKYDTSHFTPSFTKNVTINLAAEASYDIPEAELFHQAEPDVYIPSKNSGTPLPKLYKNNHLFIPLSGPIFLTLTLIIVLFLKANILFHLAGIFGIIINYINVY